MDGDRGRAAGDVAAASGLGAVLAETPRDPRSPDARSVGVAEGMSLREALEATKRALVIRAIRDSDGNMAAAARKLGMARSNLHHMMARLGLHHTD
jgi:anaerobic nitric oxide reductase transcription regulator